jgi:N-dimethylarginine dimethylaminohydrolase
MAEDKTLLDIYMKYHQPLKTKFEDEVEKLWGRRWGVNTEVGRLRMVLLHRPGQEIYSISEPYEMWRYTQKPDLKEMLKDYQALVEAFRKEGVEVVERLPEKNRPARLVKSLYTRDPSFAVPSGVIKGRMYDSLRRGEELYTMETLAGLGCPIFRVVHGTGTVEGGSVMWLDPKHLAIGLSFRVNEEGGWQVAEIIHVIDSEIDVKMTPIFGGHIDESLCMVDQHTLVVDRDGIIWAFWEYLNDELKYNIIERPKGVYLHAVALRPGRVLAASAEDKREGLKLLEKEGIDVIEVSIDSLVQPRNTGSIHCLTMPIIRDPEPLE